MMSVRPKMITVLFSSLAIAALSACNTVTSPAAQGRADSLEYDYAMNVDITASDTKASLETQYGGKVVILEPAMGYAVMGYDAAQVREQALEGNVSLERNKDAFLGGGKMAFIGGRVTAWADGDITTWGSGRVTAWADGDYTLIPLNSKTWQQIHLEQGQRLATNLGNGIKIAVIDTGIDLKHPAFTGAILEADAWDFVGNDATPQDEGKFGYGAYGHGTNIAGIVLQIAPRAKILPLRVLGADGSGDVTRVAAAINYAVSKGVQIINLSLGSNDKSSAVQKAIDFAASKGVFVIASSGNTNDQKVTFPASEAYEDKKSGPYSLSVGSVDGKDIKSFFSTYGTEKKPLEIVAPGEVVYAPAPDNRMAAWSGTSMAAPMASGALALALGQPLKVNKSELMEKLRLSASDIYGPGMNQEFKNMLGKGRLNIEQFLTDVTLR